MNHDTSPEAVVCRVFLFSGHMIDASDRANPRFPADKEVIAANAIARELQRLDAGPRDLAICSAACGGDLLFAEAALARGARLESTSPSRSRFSCKHRWTSPTPTGTTAISR